MKVKLIKKPTAELEKSEVYQKTDGEIDKVPDDSAKHEDGGEEVEDVHKVLEKTSDLRKDEDSKALKLKPEELEELTGFKPKKSMSHSTAFEKSSEYWNKQLIKLQKKLEKNLESAKNNDIYAGNSMDLNMKTLQSYPDEQTLFNTLFEHQEMTKQAAGISNRGNTAQVGGEIDPLIKNEYEAAVRDYRSGKKNSQSYLDLQQTFHTLYPQAAKQIIGALPPTTYGKKYGFPNTNLQSNEDSLYGQRTAQYIAFIEQGLDPNITPDVPVDAGDIPQISPNPTGAGDTTYPWTTSWTEKRMNINNWYDYASPLYGWLNSGRIGAKQNPVQFTEPRAKYQDPRPQLQAGQAAFNAVLPNLDPSNAANVFTQKYMMDNQIIGNNQNINNQIYNQNEGQVTDIRNRQALADQSSREVFENKYLRSLDNQRLQKQTLVDDVAQRAASIDKFKWEKDLVLSTINHYDQRGQWNGVPWQFRSPTPGANNQAPQSEIVNLGGKRYAKIQTGIDRNGQPKYTIKPL